MVAGEHVTLPPDRAVLSGAKGPTTLLKLRERGRPAHPERLVLSMDFYAPEVESKVPKSRALCREVAEEYGLQHLLDVNLGIGSHVAVETGLPLPGQFLVGSGRCLGIAGGIGALPIRLDEATLVETLVGGSLELTSPPAARVIVKGSPPGISDPWTGLRRGWGPSERPGHIGGVRLKNLRSRTGKKFNPARVPPL